MPNIFKFIQTSSRLQSLINDIDLIKSDTDHSRTFAEGTIGAWIKYWAAFNSLNIENGTSNESLQQKAIIADNKLVGFGNAKNKTDLTTRIYSKATGVSAFAEGVSTLAEGYSSHAEGQLTYAALDGAHAEGAVTRALGGSSHAEGSQTTAEANDSHAEGAGGTAKGYASHVEGCGCSTGSIWSADHGTGAHAEGYGTIAQGQFSHAEGYMCFSFANYAHTEGQHTRASGESSHSGGFATENLAARTSVNYDSNKCIAFSNLYMSTINQTGSELFVSLMDAIAATFSTGWNNATTIYNDLNVGDKIYVYNISFSKKVVATVITKDVKWTHNHLVFDNNIAIFSDSEQVYINKVTNVTVHAYSGEAKGKGCFVHGNNVYAEYDYQTVFGKYNSNGFNTLFVVGNGTDNDHRSNAFTVFDDGSVKFNKLTDGATTKTVTSLLSGISDSINVVTTAPTADNPNGYKLALLTEEPATRYNGWIYLIAE